MTNERGDVYTHTYFDSNLYGITSLTLVAAEDIRTLVESRSRVRA